MTIKPNIAFDAEVERLNFIKGSLGTHYNVLKHLAAIIHGTKLYILFPYVQHFNLEIFFRLGYEAKRSTADSELKYDFEQKFPYLKDDSRRHKGIIEQAFNLSSGLLWLHRDTWKWGRQDRYLSHMDLKPENILIDGDPRDHRTPAGIFKITDFGVSAFDKSTNSRVQEGQTIGDFAAHVASPVPLNNRRGNGPYQPPEVDLEREQVANGLLPSEGNQAMDCRKCDVWSFLCVMCEAMAFALDKDTGVDNLRNVRSQGGFYRRSPVQLDRDTVITAQNTFLKTEILGWWSQITEIYQDQWVKDMVSFLQRSMKPYPGDRASFEDICRQLKDMDKVLGLPRPTYPAKSIQNQQAPLPQGDTTLNKSSLESPSATVLSSQSPQAHSKQIKRLSGVPPAMPRQALRHDVKFRLRRQTELPYLKVYALSLDISGLRVAVLVRNEVHILPTMENEFPTESRLLSREGDWSKIQLAYPYLAAYGNGNRNSSHVRF